MIFKITRIKPILIDTIIKKSNYKNYIIVYNNDIEIKNLSQYAKKKTSRTKKLSKQYNDKDSLLICLGFSSYKSDMIDYLFRTKCSVFGIDNKIPTDKRLVDYMLEFYPEELI